MGNSSDDVAMDGTIKVETVEETTGNSEAVEKEEENLESLLYSFGDDGEIDDFVTEEEKEAAAALERRRKRKRRLEQLEASIDNDATPAINAIQAAATTVQIKKEESIPTQPAIKEEPLPESDRGENLKGKPFVQYEPMIFDDKEEKIKSDPMKTETNGSDEGNSSDDGDEDDSDSDDSDMFGSPSSEDKARKKKKKKGRKKMDNDSSLNNNNKSESNKKARENSRQDGFDDTDGYYKASIGETMDLEVLGGRGSPDHENEAWRLKLRVLGIIGKGVFSSVLKCSTSTSTATPTQGDGIPATISLGANGNENNEQQHQQHGLPSEVAIKCIRSNETMAKAALNEMKFLIRLRDSPGIVPLLLPSPPLHNDGENGTSTNPNYVPPPIDFRGHTILVFPYLPYNLRDVLQKFGKGVGLSLGAVQNYYWQLLSAAIHLQKQRVIHADIKPDNILVSADFSRVVIADFGSAFESRVQHNDDDDEEKGGSTAAATSASQTASHEAVTPYLVSRFYRAPEIILGLQPLTYAIDMWSLAVTAGELFLGKVLLRGANNNDMLRVMMEAVGPFSGRLIKSHLLQTKKHPLQAHFSQVQSNFVFKQESVDPVLGRPVHKEVSLAGNNAFKPTLQSKLLRAKSPKDTRAQILLFSDLLTKCLVLDPSKRISVKAALKHDFFVKQQQ